MLDYLDVLADLHRSLQPRTYLEIGIYRGGAFRLASPETLSVGVDPQPEVPEPAGRHWIVEATTSDAFFAGPRPQELFGELPVDLAFIDGMHLFEFALRDFTNCEALSGPDSLIVLHDCLPMDALTASRERSTDHWTGDVWKLVLCLLDRRPDLDLTVIDVPPSGLCLVRGLDRDSKVLREGMQDILQSYGPMGFEVWESRVDDVLLKTARAPEATAWSLRKEQAALRDELREREDELAALGQRLAQSESEVAELRDSLTRAESRAAEMRVRLAQSEAGENALREQLGAVALSRSWRLTAPLRRVSTFLRHPDAT